MLPDGIMTSVNDNGSDNSNQNTGDILVHRQIEIDEHPPIEATTMMKLLTTSTENAKQIKDSKNKNKILEEMDEKCMLEVFSPELMNGPPPAYSLTSPCLPPNSLREQDWPLVPSSCFDGYPPYPAGPPLLKVAYPKDIPGPTYACPKCDGRFLYYRPAGIVQCPFCHSAISIGRYVRIRACSFIMFGLLFLIISLTFGLATKILTDCSMGYFIVFAMIAISGLILLIRAFHMCFRYQETERIEFP